MPVAHQPVTEARKEVFLDVLARTGVFAWAAKAASPHSEGKKAASSSFRDLTRRDPEFAAAVTAAREEADGRLEAEAYRRAVEGVPEPVFQKGYQAVNADGSPAFVTRYSDRLLERLLEARMPEIWSQRRKVEHSGQVQQIEGDHVLSLSVSDVMGLSTEDRDMLGRILEKIARKRGELAEGEVIDVTPTPEADDSATAQIPEINQ